MNKHDFLILGAGLTGLIAACRLLEAGETGVAVVENGYGGTPYIAAFNAVLPENPQNDSPEIYLRDMMRAGYGMSDARLLSRTCALTGEAVRLLERWGVQFSKREDGGYLMRHCSGSSIPRSLCRTDRLVGEAIVEALVPALRARGVCFYSGCACVSLLVREGRALGATLLRAADGACFNVYAPRVLAAWGGVGRLYAESTYPGDVDGRGPAMAYDAGAALIDLEFVEFEPLVACEPPAAKGEPCPTAMLGEGATLLNRLGERFLLRDRPQGEAGAPKSLINQAIAREVREGRGTPLGGAYVDLRDIPQKTLEAYPWFYRRLLNAGKDVKRELLQVAPMAHSHSGGIEIDEMGMSRVAGLFAAGEAAGGLHGACRMAGNAASQSAASALLAADGMLRYRPQAGGITELPAEFPIDKAARARCSDEIGRVVTRAVGRERDEDNLTAAVKELSELAALSKGDAFTHQRAMSALLLAQAALARRESRGTHIRTDFPAQDESFRRSLRLVKNAEGLSMAWIERDGV